MGSYTDLKAIKVEKRGGVALVTINRPETRNAIDVEVHEELDEIWAKFTHDDDIQVVVLTGAGSVFCAGGDLKRMASRIGTPEAQSFTLNLPTHARKLFSNIMDMQKPLIAAVNGDAIGLGATLALFSDIVVMADTAKIGDPHVRVGLCAGDGGAVIWPLLVGPSRAKEYLMRGMLATGVEAERMNLVNYAVEADQVIPKAMEIAEDLLKMPPWAIRFTKATINMDIRQKYNAIMDASLAYEALTMTTNDFAEGTNSVIERRKPKFTGT